MYLPPSLNSAQLHEAKSTLIEEVDNIWTTKPTFHLILCGDFNHMNAASICNELDLTDVITQPTRGRNTIDHVLISRELICTYPASKVQYNAPICTSDHLTISVRPDQSVSDSTPPSVKWHKVFDYRQSNIERLWMQTALIDWSSVIGGALEVDEMWTNFHNSLKYLFESFVPYRFVPLSTDDKDWMTPLTKMLILDKWAAFRDHDWPLYNHLKLKVRNEVQKAKKIWAEKLTSNAEGLWKLVKAQQKRTHNNLNTIASEDVLLPRLVSDLSQHFSCPSSLTTDEKYTNVDPEDWNLTVTHSDVKKKLLQCSPRKASGMDAIPSKIYIELADIISIPLCSIFNASFRQKKFPKGWKSGLIVPIPKTQPPDVNKLRYITLLPLPSKICESLILDSLRSRFELAFGPQQHGFRKAASTTTALLQVFDSAARNYDDSETPSLAILSFDFSRAFDCVDHPLVIRKLQREKFPSGFLAWLRSYFENRKGFLKINSTLSKAIDICKGVPQGSVLGPALFCVFISDLASQNTRATVVKFADDVTIVLPFKFLSRVQDDINAEVDNTAAWSSANKLELNTSKSKCLLISRRTADSDLPLPKIEIVPSMKLLGVHLNNRLTWDTHVDSLRVTCCRRLHILRKLRNMIPPTKLHMVYTSIIRSRLEYACPLFVGINRKLSKILRTIDRRAHRIIQQGGSQLTCCNTNTLADRRLELSKRLWDKIENNHRHLLHSLIPHRLPRTKKFFLSSQRTNKLSNSFFPFMTSFLNYP